jgi:stage V sporulation protein G
MNITYIKIFPFDTDISQSSLKAYADVILDDLLVIKGFKILVGKSGGLFIGMPSKKGKDGKYYDQIEFKVHDFQYELRARILEAYKVFTEI